MASRQPMIAIALELARSSEALASALDAGDLDAAEALLIERGRLLDAARDVPLPTLPVDVARLTDLRTAILGAGDRAATALATGIDRVHAALGELATGARAMRAYLTPPPLAPGYIDRHD